MSSFRPKKRQEDTRTKKDLSRESTGSKHDLKRDSEKKKKDEESAKLKKTQQSPFKLDSKSSTKTISSSPKSSHKLSSPKSSPKSSPLKQSSSLYSSSSSSLVHNSSYKLSPKPSPTLTHSPKHLKTKTQQQQQPLVKVSSKISGTENKKRSEVKKREGGGEKRHSLKESYVHSLNSDEEIVEEIIEKEVLVVDPIPMEEVSEDIPHQQQHQEQDEYDDYLNEEFEEDYEEDFEDESNHSTGRVSSSSDIEDILQAIGQENQKVEDKSSSMLTVVNPTAPPPPLHLSPRPNMAFSAMTQKIKETSHKIKTRATELSTMIERETLSINLFELQPLTEYGIYMRSFGQANTCQTGTQTGQDLIEEETQTEYISHRECWTQWPPHDMKGYGRVDENEEEIMVEYDSEKLLKFLQKASQVCEMILEEEEEEEKHSFTNQKTPSSSSQQYCTIDGTINVDNTIQCISWNRTHSDMLLVGCLLAAEGCSSGLIKVWNLSRTAHPQYYLGDHSVPISCCSWYPLVFAGNDDGTINVWDLREPLSLHKHNSFGQYTLRAPTYTTAALSGDEQRVVHTQPVIHLETSGVQYGNNSQWQSGGLSFQLLSLDASGLICVWVVVELPEGDLSGSTVDLGLAPGGRVKLISSATVNVLNGIDNCIATGMVVSRVDVNTLLVGTDMGSVVCHVRYKSRAVHRHYQLDTEIFNSEVTSISLHPHFKSHFLVGYTSGHIALFHLRWPHPLITWPPSKDRNQIIRDISWHSDWSNVFMCLSGEKDLHIWDLLSNDAQPVHVMKLETRILHLKVLNTSNQYFMAISTAQDVLLYRFIQSSFQQQTKDEFENYLSTLKYY